MRALLTSVALSALLLCSPSASADEDKGLWPFGIPAEQSPARGGKDVYNLGILGVKVRDAERPLKPTFEGGGKRQSSSKDAGELADEGPNRLYVEMLFPGGPADEAGLRVGDVIVGAPKVWKEGSLEPLSEMLIKAESGKSKGIVTLRVEREGEKGVQKVEVPVPQGGKPAAKPFEDPHRQKLVDAGLQWLADQQAGSGGYAQTLSGANGAVILTSLAGLAWLAGGSDLEQGKYKDNVSRAVDFVLNTVGSIGRSPGETSDGPNWDQSNWGYAHAAILLGELYARTPRDDIREALLEYGDSLSKRQEKSGGWAHGPGGPNALNYVELNIVSGLALCGIGLSRKAGYEPPQEMIDKATEYLADSGSGDGGVAYSHKGGQRGSGNIGRTAGTWLGFVTLGLRKEKWGKKMEKYVRGHAGEMFGGHASLKQHFLLAGVAAHAQGSEARKKFWEVSRREMTIARAPDGSFQPRPWHETLSIGSNSDVSFGQVWTTTVWTIVLACEPSKDGSRPGLPAWMGLDD